MSDTTHPSSPMTKGGPKTPDLRIDEQGASTLTVRQHGEREEKNEFEKLVSVATSLQDSKPAQVLTLEWRRPRADGHKVAGTDIVSAGEPDNDSRIDAFWKRFPNVLK